MGSICLGLWDTCPECPPRDDYSLPEGRCRTSLDGGNRGTHPCRCSGQKRYGDLSVAPASRSTLSGTFGALRHKKPASITLSARAFVLCLCLLTDARHAQPRSSLRRACRSSIDVLINIDFVCRGWSGEFFMMAALGWLAHAQSIARSTWLCRNVGRQRQE